MIFFMVPLSKTRSRFRNRAVWSRRGRRRGRLALLVLTASSYSGRRARTPGDACLAAPTGSAPLPLRLCSDLERCQDVFC